MLKGTVVDTVDTPQDCRKQTKNYWNCDLERLAKSLSKLDIKFVKDILGNFLLQPSSQCNQWAGKNKSSMFSVLEFPDIQKAFQMQY